MAGEKILIAGAGIGGLVAAACLLQRGFDVEIYEQASTLAEVGAGIQMSANAMHVLRSLGLGDAIERVGVKPEAYVFRLHDTGEVIQRFELSKEHEKQHGAPYVQLHRADLHELLVSRVRELKPDVIHLNSKLASFSEDSSGVTLSLADGSQVRGEMLIGADGVKSVVRAQIAGAVDPVYTGDSVWRITVPSERLPKGLFEQVMSVFMGPGRHAVCYFLRGGALLNFVGCVESEPSEESWTLRFPWERLSADFVGWHSMVRTVLEAADRDRCYRWSLYARPLLKVWSTRRATILGDSAHATLPYLAQGAAMAIEDGCVLARALSEIGDVGKALDVYQRARTERTARIVHASSENRQLFHLKSEAEIRQRFASRNEGAQRNQWLYSYNPLTVPLQ